MNDIVIDIKNLSKRYELGTISSGTLSRDLTSLWARIRGKKDPNSIIASSNDLQVFNGADSIWALKDINFEVKQGEILGIIGKNGAGKSTLLKILSRITAPTKGEIKIKGRIASLLEVGTGFHPELTGRENIYLNGAILGMMKDEIKTQLDAIIDFSGIEKYINTPIKRYSTGMKVRLGFAVAAFLQVDILMVDEVLAVGDIEFQKKALSKMDLISKGEGKTIIFVSHNLQAIKHLTHRCILLSKGVLGMIDDTDLVVASYLESQKKYFFNKKQLADNDYIYIRDIKLLNEAGIEKESFYYNEDIFVTFIYELKKYNKLLRIAFSIVDSFDNIIFTSADYPNGERDINLRERGKYRASAKIPQNFFNEGEYSIIVTCGIPFKQKFMSNDKIFSFSIIFQEVLTGSISEKFDGSLFPKLEWETLLDV